MPELGDERKKLSTEAKMTIVAICLLGFSIAVDIDAVAIVVASFFAIALVLIIKKPVGKSGGVFLSIFGLIQIGYGIFLLFDFSTPSIVANAPRIVGGIIGIMAGFMHFEASDDLILGNQDIYKD